MKRKYMRLFWLFVTASFLFCCSCGEQGITGQEQITQEDNHYCYTGGWSIVNGNRLFSMPFMDDAPSFHLPEGFDYQQNFDVEVLPDYYTYYDLHGRLHQEFLGYTTKYYSAYFSTTIEWDQTDYRKTDAKGNVFTKRDFKNIVLDISLVYADEVRPDGKFPDLSFVGKTSFPDQIGEWISENTTPPASEDSGEYYFRYSVLAMTIDGSKTETLHIYANRDGQLIACRSRYADPVNYSNGSLVHTAIGEEYDYYVFIGGTKYVW